jgi:hypothetical protein
VSDVLANMTKVGDDEPGEQFWIVINTRPPGETSYIVHTNTVLGADETRRVLRDAGTPPAEIEALFVKARNSFWP